MMWQDDARCKGKDPELFFVTRRETVHKLQALCASCPVLVQCRSYAIREEPLGFWGGMTQRERRATRDRHGIPHPSAIKADDQTIFGTRDAA